MVGRYRCWRAAALAGAMVLGVCPSPALSQGAPPPAEPSMTQATERFFAGQKLYGDKKFEEALAEFRASYAAVPSPNSRLYIARCLRRLGRNAAAYDEYGQVILEAADKAATDKKYAATQQAAVEERAEIKDKVGTIKLAVPAGVAGVTVKVGAEEVPAARWGQPVAADVGSVTVRAEAPGRAPFEKTIEVTAAQQQEVVVELPEAKGTSGGGEGGGGAEGGGGGKFLGPVGELPLRPISIAMAGVGVAGLVLWGVFGTKAEARYEDLDAKCDGPCDPFYQDQIDAGRRETAAATAGLVIGIVGVVGGATIFTLDLLNRKGGSDAGSAGATTSLRVVPNPKAPFVAVGGAF